MALNPLALFTALGAGALFLSAASKPAGSQSVVEIKAGETWILTIRAVGGKLGQAEEDQMRYMIPQVGELKSLVRNDAGDMMVIVVKYSKPTHVILNQLIALTTSPDRGVMVTDAVQVPDQGPIVVPKP